MKRTLLLVLFLTTTTTLLLSWGDEGHRAANRVAASKIPPDMPRFLAQRAAEIEYLGPEPDRWRERRAEPFVADANYAEHYVDLERLEGFGEWPVGRNAFLRKLEQFRAGKTPAEDYTIEKIGLNPYVTMEIYDRLKAAFREYRQRRARRMPTAGTEHAIVFYAGWLGHYVADSSNPLHTTIHYDGWVSPQNPKAFRTERGLHGEFESAFVRNNPEVLRIAPLVGKPAVLTDPWRDYRAYVNESFALVPRVYEMEKTGAFRDQGTLQGREFVRQRIARGSQMLLNLWYTAWVKSAEPLPKR